MSKVNSTPSVTPSPEYTRRAADGGLELVKTVQGVETVTPVRVTSKIVGKRLVVGFEAR